MTIGKLRYFLALGAIMFFFVAGNNKAMAQFCSISAGNLNFGTVDVSAGLPVTTTSTLSIFCLGVPGRTVRVCPNFNAGIGGVSAGGDPRQMLSGINQLNYNIYQDAAYSQVWGSHVWGFPPTPPTIDIPLSGGFFFGFGSTTRVIRGRVNGGQSSVPAGSYISQFSGNQTRVSYRYTTSGNCATISAITAGTTTPFNATANVVSTCTVSANTMNFGTAGVLSSNVDTTNTISVNCNSGLPYQIGLDNGLTGSSPILRRMTNGGESVTYGIYRNSARTQSWGDTVGTNTVGSVGTGLIQNFTAYGRVPVQPTPSAGTFTDTIVVTVTY